MQFAFQHVDVYKYLPLFFCVVAQTKDMDSLYLETNNQLNQIQHSLAELERAPTLEEANQVQQKIETQLNAILGNCDRLDIMVSKEPPARRRNAKYRVDQLKYDYQHLRAALQQLLTKRFQKQRCENEREELLARRFTSNDSTTRIYMQDANIEHNNKLLNANRHVDDMLSQGSSILENLHGQHMSLKGVRRKILDLTNMLGLSNTVMRAIERRTTQDRIILFGGMILTLVLMYFLYCWLGPRK